MTETALAAGYSTASAYVAAVHRELGQPHDNSYAA